MVKKCYNIEHILPKDTKKWIEHLASISDTVYLEFIHKIGNLTLTKLNSEMSNDSFKDKKAVYKTSNYCNHFEIYQRSKTICE